MPTKPEEHHLEVSRTARFYTLGEPKGGADTVWVVCHGYGQLAGDFVRFFEVLDDGSTLVAAPEGLSRFYLDSVEGNHGSNRVGASWMTREDRLNEIADYTAYLDHLVARITEQHPHASLNVLGFSQGCPTVARWYLRSDWRVDRLVFWGGFLPPEVDLRESAERIRQSRLTIVMGDQDEIVELDKVPQGLAALEEHGIEYRFVSFSGGHRMDRETLREIAAS